MLVATNIMTLTTLGYIDYWYYKIPNVILVGWAMTIVSIQSINSTIPITTSSIVLALVIAGSYIPLRQIVKCSAGDFKLFAVLGLACGSHITLVICLITMLISLIPLACGAKKVPIAFTTLLGYTAFLLFK